MSIVNLVAFPVNNIYFWYLISKGRRGATAFLYGGGHTLYFGLVFPTTKSTKCDITGKSSKVLNPGICLATANTVGKKLPNKFRNPNVSMQTPSRPHLNRTNAIPRKKQKVPRSRSGLVNSVKDLLKPIVNNKPRMKRVLPMAISAVSKNIKIPRKIRPKPRQIKPMPIFWLSSRTILMEKLVEQFCDSD